MTVRSFRVSEIDMTSEQDTSSSRPKLFSVWLFVLVLVMLGFALLGDRGVLRAMQSWQHREDLVGQVDLLHQEQQRLRAEIRRLRDDRDYWEQLARKELGMVREGEIVYQFPVEKPGH